MISNLDIFKNWHPMLKTEFEKLSSKGLLVVCERAGISHRTVICWIKGRSPSMMNYIAFMQACKEFHKISDSMAIENCDLS